MSSHGFTTTATGASVGDVFDSKASDEFVHVRADATVQDAVKLMAERGLTRLPVTSAEPPVVMGEVLGSVSEASLADAVASGRVQFSDPVATVIGDAIRLIGAGQSSDDLSSALAETDTVMVARDGKPLGILTRRDLLAYLSR
jgi:cystathionine beta-synthase